MNDKLEKLFELYYSKIFNYILFQVGGVTLAEDLSSETFLRAIKYYAGYDSERSSEYTWLRTIAKNVISTYFAKPGSVPLEELDENLMSPSDPQFETEDAELKLKLAQLVFELPDKQKELITMKYTLGMTKREIADELNMTESNVGVSLHRITKELRSKLEKWA
jgi:RNA polymerase sigma-70 factor (ECF subfamily)